MKKNKILKKLLKILKLTSNKPKIALIKLNGIIGAGSTFKSGINLEAIDSKITEAFDSSNLSAVAFVINSPGGSPVQSEIIFNRIRSLSEEKNVKVLTFVEDVAASGGYWLACAGDKIYAAQNSIIGSIGVVSSGFGFYKAIEKLGIERRIYSEGKSKSILDPFMPEKKEDIEILKEAQRDIYENFKNLVLSRRTNTNKKNHGEIFSGAIWSSKKAIEFGLIDEIGDFYTVIKKDYGKDAKIKRINFEKSWIKSLISSFCDIAINRFGNLVEERYMNSKIGL